MSLIDLTSLVVLYTLVVVYLLPIDSIVQLLIEYDALDRCACQVPIEMFAGTIDAI
jgi:hypothetical protein